jgi:uncharacterized protein (DUF488 family)
MYYRRKILLALLQTFDNQLEKISLQKLLFLFVQQQEQKAFHFVPYKYGCYSFQANADLLTMIKYDQVSETEKHWKKTDAINYISELKLKDQNAVKYIKYQYGNLNANDLIKLTYIRFPYYAINSIIASTVLTLAEKEKVDKERPVKSGIVLFTIGYEGISLEEYLNKLLINDVKVLCDVRKNSLSMKYGFSKSQLQKACIGTGIEYIHFPEVGIESNKRQELETQADYDKLFTYYRNTVLKNETEKQKEILNLLQSKKRIALTCFEANINQCHRKHLAEAIAQSPDFNYEIKHI